MTIDQIIQDIMALGYPVVPYDPERHITVYDLIRQGVSRTTAWDRIRRAEAAGLIVRLTVDGKQARVEGYPGRQSPVSAWVADK